jgi:hypothetical protein
MSSILGLLCALYGPGLWPGTADLALILPASALQTPRTPDFTGRWILVSPEPATLLRQPSLNLAAADELVVTQDAVSFTVSHPASLEGFPQSGTHRFGSSGVTGSGGQSWSDTFWFGTELIITAGMQLPGSDGRRSSWSERWSLESDGRLEIRIVAERPGAATEGVTLVYRRSAR